MRVPHLLLRRIEHVQSFDVVLALHLEVLAEVVIEEARDLLLVVLSELELRDLALELKCANQSNVVVAYM